MLVGIIMIPYYISNLGAESYGLVGFFSLLSTWMNLLDMGMTPTLSREVSAARGIRNGMFGFQKLLRSFEIIFFCTSIIVFVLIFIFRNWLSSEWIKSTGLSSIEIAKCIIIMGILLGLRWFSTLYRSIIVGFELQVALNILNIVFSSLKFIAVLLVFKFISNDIFVFFEYQLVLGIIEVLILTYFVYSKFTKYRFKIPILFFDWTSIKRVMPFTLGFAYSSTIWILVSQVDKLILSGILNLKEFGYFNLVIVVSSTITTLASPISQAILPRMVYLFSINCKEEMINLYKSATQLVTIVSGSLMIVIAIYSENIIYAWTGNLEAAKWAKNVLFWYALGNGVLAILSFQHYLQVAIGQLKLQVFGGTMSVIIDVPIIIFFSYNYGAVSTGIVWFLLRIFWFLFWTPYVHNKYIPKMHVKWAINDVFIIIVSIIISALLLNYIFPVVSTNRFLIFFHLSIIGLIVLICGGLASSFIRNKISHFLRTKTV